MIFLEIRDFHDHHFPEIPARILLIDKSNPKVIHKRNCKLIQIIQLAKIFVMIFFKNDVKADKRSKNLLINSHNNSIIKEILKAAANLNKI